jgi:DNA-binding MarR family transcriptional regulator
MVTSGISAREYQLLAELRFRIRRFLRSADDIVRRTGVSPLQYLILLAIRGLPRNDETTIRVLASRVALKHHSAVEPVDRLEEHDYVRPSRGQKDRGQAMHQIPAYPRQLQDLNQARNSPERRVRDKRG